MLYAGWNSIFGCVLTPTFWTAGTMRWSLNVLKASGDSHTSTTRIPPFCTKVAT